MKRILLVVVLVAVAHAQSVLGSHYGNARISSNAAESILTPATVGSIGLLGDYTVDGAVFSSPLIIRDVNTGSGYHDLLLVCTMSDSCYGFDANMPGSAPVWHTIVGTPQTTYPGGAPVFYGAPNGCVATPAIDPYQWMMYIVCGVAGPNWTIFQLSVSTGQITSSAIISGQVTGTGMSGDTVIGGQLQFSPYYALARGITLANGNVYVTFSSHDDFSMGSWHGWVFAYSTSTMLQTAVFCTTPNGSGGSIWQANSPPAVDSNGNLYVLTGNGTYDGVSNWANSLLKFSPSLQLLDWFTPSDYLTVSMGDYDLSSSRPMLIPGAGLVVFSFKGAVVYSMPTNCLGHLQGGSPCALQVLSTMVSFAGHDNGVYSGAAYQNGNAYFAPVGGPIFAFLLSGGVWAATTTGSMNYAFPGATMTVSSQSGANPILWATSAATNAETSSAQGTLYALNLATFAPYWSVPVGTLSKFVPPLVSGGRVYMPTLDGVVHVYGLPISRGITVRKGILRGSAALR